MRLLSTVLCLIWLAALAACHAPRTVEPQDAPQEKTGTEEETEPFRPVIPPSVLAPRPYQLRSPVLLGR